MKSGNLIRLTSAALLLFLLASCGGVKKQIVGKWKTSNGSGEVAWEFFENGSVTTDGAPGRYTFGDNERIKIQTQTATFIYQLKIEGDRMTWTAPPAPKMEFTRAK